MYNTKAATTIVKINPGTRPSSEYDHGKDMIARQMYSEKSSAAVYKGSRVRLMNIPILTSGETVLRTTSPASGYGV